MTSATNHLVLPWLAAMLVAAMLVAPVPARAQQPEAESLFREGKALLKKGKIAQACEKFEASEQVDPTIGTELNLADCREKNRQYASAWGMFLKAAATAKKGNDPRRATEAKRRAKLLEPKLRYLTIKVAEDRRVEGLAITRDGTVVDPAVWNQRVPVDQGTHDIAAKAPGRETWKEQVEIEKSDEVVEMPALGEVATPPPTDKVEKTPPPPPPKEVVRATPQRRYRAVTFSLAVISFAGLGVGVGFGLNVRSLSNDADAVCPNDNCLDPNALDLNKRARKSALFANVGFAAGGVALVATTILLWKGKPAAEKVAIVPIAGANEIGLALGGGF